MNHSLSPKLRLAEEEHLDPQPTIPTQKSSMLTYEEIESWIGSPRGKGQAKNQFPMIGEIREVKVFTSDEQRSTKRIKTIAKLGAGFTGTVYEKVEVDEQGNEIGPHFVEKYYDQIQPEGLSKTIGLFLVRSSFKLFRGTPLSYRINLWATLSNHYANQLISEASEEHFGRRITPRLLYTRYDETSGGYVQAYEMVRGREVKADYKEIRQAISYMRQWRRFLEKDLGLLGIARQTNIRTLVSLNNVRIDEEGNFVLLDTTPGVMGVPWEIEYWGKGLMSGFLPPFSDTVLYRSLENYVIFHGRLRWIYERFRSDDADLYRRLRNYESYSRRLKEIYQRFRFFTSEWTNSEPIFFKSPLRLFQLMFSPALRKTTAENLLIQLEHKGVFSSLKAERYYQRLREKGRFFFHVLLLIHRILNFLPVTVHRALTDREFRIEIAKNKITQSIDEFERRGLQTPDAATELRGLLAGDDGGRVELLQLLGIQFMLKMIIPPGASISVGLAGVLLGQWWLFPLVFLDGFLRATLTVVFTGLKHTPAMMIGLIPVLGNFAVPVEMKMRHDDQLSLFIVEAMASKVATLIPGLGEKGSLIEVTAIILARIIWRLTLPIILISALSVAIPQVLPVAFSKLLPITGTLLLALLVGELGEEKKREFKPYLPTTPDMVDEVTLLRAI